MGGGSSPDSRTRWETLKIEYRDGGMITGRSILTSLMGLGSIYSRYFVGRYVGPDGEERRTDIAEFSTFDPEPLELMSNPDE